MLFSHPRDFTPVCTTELGYMASIKPDFDSRNTKVIGLSVDNLDNHEAWAKDIEETQGTAPNYPIIGDSDFNVSKLYGMLPADVEGEATERTPAQNQTVRNVFVIGPDKKVKLILVYPMTTGRNFDEVLRVIDSLQLTAKHKVATPGAVAAGRRRDHRRLGLQRGREGDLPGRLGVPQAVHPDRAAAELSLGAARSRRSISARSVVVDVALAESHVVAGSARHHGDVVLEAVGRARARRRPGRLARAAARRAPRAPAGRASAAATSARSGMFA